MTVQMPLGSLVGTSFPPTRRRWSRKPRSQSSHRSKSKLFRSTSPRSWSHAAIPLSVIDHQSRILVFSMCPRSTQSLRAKATIVRQRGSVLPRSRFEAYGSRSSSRKAIQPFLAIIPIASVFESGLPASRSANSRRKMHCHLSLYAEIRW